MATLFDTTITDKKTFAVKIVDNPKYDKLSKDDQKIFELLRNSLLEIFPTNDKGIFEIETIRFAENYAFINLDAFKKGFDILFDLKIKDFETKIKEYINTQTTAATSKTVIAGK